MRERSATNRRLAAALVAAVLVFAIALPARAARPLLDSGKWDNYFALFARNASVPWKKITLRLDTYSGAAVDFAAYDVDPTDVLVAGANARPRALDATHRTPVAKWRFTPPPGLTFASNDVEVPLLNREGFFVIEARRGTAIQQVWINLSRVGLITKESPAGSIVYGADLGTGRALRGMRLTYLVGTKFAYDSTDAHGISRVPARAAFALAEWGHSKSFVSFFPQSPPAAAVLGVRADRASARAGEAVRVVGFARRRSGNVFRPATGDVALTVVAGGKTLASGSAALDKAGSFNASLTLPDTAPAGDAAILAAASGASGGATIHIDGTGDTSLAIVASCTTACPAAAEIPLAVTARRAGVAAEGSPVRVRIVRSPHVQSPERLDEALAWGVTTVLDTTVRTDALGTANVSIPAPTDGLASTYGVTASSGPSTASSNLVAPNAAVALSVIPVDDSIDVSDPAIVDVHGFDALDGSPAGGLNVRVRIAHGPTVQEKQVTLGRDGSARVTFANVALGMNLVRADVDVDGKTATDVAAVTVAPRALSGAPVTRSGEVKIALDRARLKPNDKAGITASLSGATGDALITMESVRGVTSAVVPAPNGSATAQLTVPETIGALSVGVVFVRDGAMVDSAVPLVIDGPGHQSILALSSDRATYAPSSVAKISLTGGDESGAGTMVVRVSDRRAAGGASFDDTPGVLAARGTTTQNLSSLDPPWHTWVAPAKSTAGDIFGFDRPRQAANADTQIAAAATRVLTWRVDRSDKSTFDVTVPKEPGRYVLSVIKMTDDGDVGAASLALMVQ